MSTNHEVETQIRELRGQVAFLASIVFEAECDTHKEYTFGMRTDDFRGMVEAIQSGTERLHVAFHTE